MRIGITLDFMHVTKPGSRTLSWASVRDQALAAERVGFDVLAVPDAFLYRLDGADMGFYESVAVAAAVLESTSTIDVAHDMMNTPYRQPTLIAQIARTLSDIGDGRYWLGLGAGNTWDSDYRAVGVPTDHRYSRFAETVQIVHGLLAGETVDFDGAFHQVTDAEVVLPAADRPPITIGAFSPKTMRLAARYADQWGGYVFDQPTTVDTHRPLIEELQRACEDVGRDPATLRRSIDAPVDPHGRSGGAAAGGHGPLTGTAEEIAEAVLSFRELGIEEFRCEVAGRLSDGAATVEAMADIVELVHTG